MWILPDQQLHKMPDSADTKTQRLAALWLFYPLKNVLPIQIYDKKPRDENLKYPYFRCPTSLK